MKKIGFLFPGQGSQAPGMGQAAAARNDAARALFSRADQVLGFSLSTLCAEGPEEELKKTENTQPALYVASAATLEVLRAEGIEPFAVAGHSLGEYSALYAAGAFDFETGLRLVRTRGQAFATAGEKRPGAMAAIVGLDVDQVTALCREASTSDEIAVPANLNEPAQVVISGDPAAIHRACEKAKAAGAKRALPLPVSGAFHSPLVEPAAATMRQALDAAEIRDASLLFVNNADATVVASTDLIRTGLVRQVTSAVLWIDCVRRLLSEGVEEFIEVGSGKVLSGLVRRIHKDIPCHTTESEAAIEKTLAALKG